MTGQASRRISINLEKNKHVSRALDGSNYLSTWEFLFFSGIYNCKKLTRCTPERSLTSSACTLGSAFVLGKHKELPFFGYTQEFSFPLVKPKKIAFPSVKLKKFAERSDK